jgi:molybdopterin/thiamine biosynthesis adenylyltransferase/rhodanese-related sulfurtransferase
VSDSVFKRLLEKLRAEIRELAPEQLSERLQAGHDFTLLDVREADEWRQGHVPGAVFVPRGLLELKVEELVPDRNREVILYCAGAERSVFAVRSLQEMGYANVSSMAGGFDVWKHKGLPIRIPETLSERRRDRYSRHLLLPELGEAGQLRLLKGRVLVVGAGGLGCPAALYLAAAGVGTIGVIDGDVVDFSNLQRQILHTEDRVGMAKVESAARTLAQFNSDVKVNRYNQRLTRHNIMELLESYDLLVDGSDNFATRYLINDASVWSGKPVVHGSIFRFEGHVTVFKPGDGPCYRCLYPEPPPAELAPNCQEVGVLGVLPGVVGLLEAAEAIKLLLDKGETLVGRLLLYDALSARFRELRVRRDPDCRVCGARPSIRDFIEYEEFCRSR